MAILTAKLSGAAPIFFSRFALTRAATIGDQLLVAFTNFGLTLAIGRAFSHEDLASYGIGLSMGLMVQGLQRHALNIPLMLEPEARAVRRHKSVLAEQLIVLLGALAAGAIALAAAYVSDASRYAHLLIAASVVCLLIFTELEFARAFLIKIKRPGLLLATAFWYAAVTGTLIVLSFAHWIGYETLLAVLAGAILIHYLASIVTVGAPDIAGGLRVFSANMKRYGGWAGIATATYAGYNHVPLLTLGVFTAPIHAAAFVATRSLMQPLQILLRGLDIADKSVFSEGTRKSRPDALTFTMKLAAIYAAIGMAFGLAISLFAEKILAFAYGTKFTGFEAALIAWIPVYILLSVTMPFESLVYTLRNFRGYYLIRGIASLVSLALTVPLVIRFSEVGAISACAAGWLVAVAGTAVLLRRSART
jgi:O-antigen/teichoic acid export membrane protein